MNRFEYDAIVIGFGKGGKTLAGKLAGDGKRVALAEMDANMYGGTCINVGCIPSKALIVSAANVSAGASEAERAQAFQAAVLEKRRLTDEAAFRTSYQTGEKSVSPVPKKENGFLTGGRTDSK